MKVGCLLQHLKSFSRTETMLVLSTEQVKTVFPPWEGFFSSMCAQIVFKPHCYTYGTVCTHALTSVLTSVIYHRGLVVAEIIHGYSFLIKYANLF